MARQSAWPRECIGKLLVLSANIPTDRDRPLWIAISPLAAVLFLAACPASLSRTDVNSGNPDSGALPDSGGNPDGGGGSSGDGGSPDGGLLAWAPFSCPPLPAATGTTLRVGPAQVNDLAGIVSGASADTTILFDDGIYRWSGADEASRRLNIRAPGVTLRSASGNAAAVILDGEYVTNEIINVLASRVTVAEITLMHAKDHLIHVTPPSGSSGITSTKLYGLRLIDSGQQFVKVNSNLEDGWADDGSLECSSLSMTDDGRTHVDTVSTDCYTGGIDAHGSRGWVVRQNRMEAIFCTIGLAEHAIHFWSGTRDTLVENNFIVNCSRGIGLGLGTGGTTTRTYPDNPYPDVGYIGDYDGLIRNNVIYSDNPYIDTGIGLENAHGARVYHNTVFSTPAATGLYSSIDYRFPGTLADIRNNLTYRITARDGATASYLRANVEQTPASDFVDPAAFDFRLRPSATDAIDKGEVVPNSGLDIVGRPHDYGPPDIGAHEYRP